MLVDGSVRARIEGLSPEQRRHLLQQLESRRSKKATLRARGATRGPLSVAQRNLWFMNEVEGDRHKYNMVSAYRLRGALDQPALERALAFVVDRHQILKSRFVENGDDPLQELIPDFALSVPLFDLTELGAAERDSRLQELLAAEGRHTFDLTAGPLFRVCLYRLSPNEHVLQLNVHHAIFDGWSKGLLFRELESAYSAYRRDGLPDLPPLQLQFADFAAWQRESMDGQLDEQLRFWQDRLSGAPALLNLPTDFPRPAARSSEAEVARMFFDAELLEKLRALAGQCGATLFMTVLAAFALLLRRCTDQDDICVASPVDNRSHRELHKLIGYFLNTVVLRTRFRSDMSVRDLLRSVRETTLEAFQHQDAPFEQVVSSVAPVRSQSFSPLNQVMFVFQHGNVADPSFDGLSSAKLMGGNETTKYDLYATFKEADGGLCGWFYYRADLFRATTIESLSHGFRTLMRQMVDDPDARVEDLTMLDTSSRENALAAASGARVESRLRTLHEAFAARAVTHPERVAVRDRETDITFADLEKEATRLAGILVSRGVRPGSVVGVHARRGAWYVQALLAIWKAGATVVPLDTLQPTERLRKVVERVCPCLVLHDRDEELEFAGGRPTLSARAAAGASAEPAAAEASSRAPAFVLFTSGSTGVPKGVVGTHDGVLNRLEWQWHEYPPPADEIVAQRVNIGFVDSFTETWATLLAGGTLAALDDETLRDPFELVAALQHHRITTLYAVPSLLRTILEAFPELQGRLPDLRLLVLSGEPLTSELVKKIVEALPAASIANVYGATEAADASAAEHALLIGRDRVPIGRPLSNMRLYVLDDWLRLCPTGVEGTLYVEGPSVATGYWDEPRLTATKFLPSPYSDRAGSRMYCLGDRARRLADGSVEYLRRQDGQIKLRGLRIEIEEIERVIEQCAGVAAACVVAVATDADDSALVAYVKAEQDARIDRASVANHIKRYLPDYMHPNALALCDSLPHTASGKVDRETLRARGLPAQAAEERREARTETERRLVRIWQDILRVREPSVIAGFFDLGGHSLLAMRVVARIRQEFGIKLSAQDVFRLLTIENVAERLDAQCAVGQSLHDAAAAASAVEITEF